MSVDELPKILSKWTERSENRKTKVLSKSYTNPHIVYFAQSKFQKLNKGNTVMLFKGTLTIPTKSIKIKSAYLSSLSIRIISYTPNKVIAFILNNNLSKQQYTNIRELDMLWKTNINIYVSRSYEIIS